MVGVGITLVGGGLIGKILTNTAIDIAKFPEGRKPQLLARKEVRKCPLMDSNHQPSD